MFAVEIDTEPRPLVLSGGESRKNGPDKGDVARGTETVSASMLNSCDSFSPRQWAPEVSTARVLHHTAFLALDVSRPSQLHSNSPSFARESTPALVMVLVLGKV